MKKMSLLFMITLALLFNNIYAVLEIKKTYNEGIKTAYLDPTNQELLFENNTGQLVQTNLETGLSSHIPDHSTLNHGHKGPILLNHRKSGRDVQTTISTYNESLEKQSSEIINNFVGVQAGSNEHAKWLFGTRNGTPHLYIRTPNQVTAIPDRLGESIIGLYSTIFKLNCFRRKTIHTAVKQTADTLTIHRLNLNASFPQISVPLGAGLHIKPSYKIYCSPSNPSIAIADDLRRVYLYYIKQQLSTLQLLREYAMTHPIQDLCVDKENIWTIDNEATLAQYSTEGGRTVTHLPPMDYITLEKANNYKILTQTDAYIVVGNDTKTYLIKKN